jgi:hypothetical protein
MSDAWFRPTFQQRREQALRLRSEARRCRQLAFYVFSDHTRKTLEQSANEHDAEAAKLEAIVADDADNFESFNRISAQKAFHPSAPTLMHKWHAAMEP